MEPEQITSEPFDEYMMQFKSKVPAGSENEYELRG